MSKLYRGIQTVDDAFNRGVAHGSETAALGARPYIIGLGAALSAVFGVFSKLEVAFARIDEVAQVSKGMRRDIWESRLKEHSEALELIFEGWKATSNQYQVPKQYIDESEEIYSSYQKAMREADLSELKNLGMNHPINNIWAKVVGDLSWTSNNPARDRADELTYELWEKNRGYTTSARAARKILVERGDEEAAQYIPPNNDDGQQKQYGDNAVKRVKKKERV